MHKNQSKSLFVVIFTIFLDMLGYGILIPVIPLLLADPGSSEYILPLGYSIKQGYILLGFLTAAFPLMQFLATPILGQLSDRFGRKKILGVSLAGTCLSYLIFAYAIISHNIPLLFFARAFDGLTGGNIAVAQAAIADITKPEDRSKNFGLMGMAFGFGFIFGPFLGGVLSNSQAVSWFNAATPFWFAGLLSFTNILLLIKFFPETNIHINPELKIKFGQSLANIARAFNLKELRVVYWSLFLLNGGFTFFTTFLSVYFIQKLNFNQTQIGNFFAFVGLMSAVTQGLITGRVAKKFAEHQVLKIAPLMSGIGIMLYAFASHKWQIYAITPLFAVFNGLTMANFSGLISKSVGPKIQGEVLGISASVQALAQSIPPMLSGFIAAGLKPSSPIFVGSLFIILSWLVFIVFYKQKTESA